MLKSREKNIFKYIAVVGLLIFLHFIKILSPIEDAIINVFRPALSKIYTVGSELNISYSEQTNKKDLIKVIDELKKERNKLIAEKTKLEFVREENEKLRQYLKFFTTENYNYVLANVISQNVFIDAQKQNQYIIIDKGRKDGLADGLAVLDGQGVLVGKIAEVEENISKVFLVTNQDCKLAVLIQNQAAGQERTAGIAQGDLGLTVKLDFIPQTQKIEIGQLAVTSGLEEKIKRGLVIGKIVQVNSGSNEVWQTAVIEPLANLNELVIASVLLP
ncbi:rod shape-determining protein MreC [Candidatus Falkowbacteria bacterium CG11_big_fil_rev_8_21_14_0_20_39_10]|uniref:Cell shape-determining protein MreC n=1 Tax=Candidatus Falkowbacteria bacterium CG11_big_fil_rev_8_21_14_0_20_39_10 TaxID=1974570 RepID=A0A2M6K8T9_9BACT|nr:MAG: rod shape-determining protein MreC [Candidatus Falkowbacteria bacterium CG11_big_fil_rev_8_21_14_0_20_39_10]